MNDDPGKFGNGSGQSTGKKMNEAVEKIVEREFERRKSIGILPDSVGIEMDVTSAIDAKVVDPLVLADADDVTFGHDMNEIDKHIDRTVYPGTFPDWFCPRTFPREEVNHG